MAGSGGSRRPGIREVARLAGVGTASVSRVLSGHPDISERMRQRVMAAVAELDYQPDVVAQSLRRQATRSVGFVLSDISNPLLSEIVHGAETVLRTAGFSMLLTNSDGSPDLDAQQIRQLWQRRLDGMLLLPAAEDHPETQRLLASVDVPIVVIDRDLPAELEVNYVLSDHRQGMQDAVEHLVSLGHRRIGVVTGQDVRPSRERLRAIRQAIAETGRNVSLDVEAGLLSASHGRVALDSLLAQEKAPTAVILGGNLLLIGALEVVQQRRITLGRDLSLISCDDVPLARLADQPVSVVTRDAAMIGQTAAKALLSRIRGEQNQNPVLLPTRYVPRASSGPAP